MAGPQTYPSKSGGRLCGMGRWGGRVEGDGGFQNVQRRNDYLRRSQKRKLRSRLNRRQVTIGKLSVKFPLE